MTEPLQNQPYSSSNQSPEKTKLSEYLNLRAAQQTNTPNTNNYILPTFANDYGKGYDLGEVYADVRLEQDKKNLLTLPTDPNKMYIKNSQEGYGAEVILYPMGQLLGGPSRQQPQLLSRAGSGAYLADPVYAAPSSTQPRVAQPRDPAPAPSGGLDQGQDIPKGLLQTIMRSAKDDLKIVGNVFKHLTGS